MELDNYEDDADIFPRQQIQTKLEQSGLDLVLIILALFFLIAMSILFVSI